MTTNPMKGTPMTEPQEDQQNRGPGVVPPLVPGRGGPAEPRPEGGARGGSGSSTPGRGNPTGTRDDGGQTGHAAANVPADQGAREARYAEAMFRSDCDHDGISAEDADWLWESADNREGYVSKARAVLPLVDAEVAAAVSEAQAEAASLRVEARRHYAAFVGAEAELSRVRAERNIAVNTVKASTPDFDVASFRIQCEQRAAADRRAESAEAEVERLREGIRSLHTKGYASASEEVWGQNPQCDECGVAWPCDTIALLDASPVATTGEAICAKDVGDPPDVCRCLLTRGHGGLHECKHKHPVPVLGWASSEIGGAVSAKPGWWLPAPVSPGEADDAEFAQCPHEAGRATCPDPCGCSCGRQPCRVRTAPVSSGEAGAGEAGEAGRAAHCIKAWPDCREGEFNPACCRFPKSCSCNIVVDPRPAPVVTPSAEGSE